MSDGYNKAVAILVVIFVDHVVLCFDAEVNHGFNVGIIKLRQCQLVVVSHLAIVIANYLKSLNNFRGCRVFVDDVITLRVDSVACDIFVDIHGTIFVSLLDRQFDSA